MTKKAKRGKEQNFKTTISKALTYILRHGAHKQKIPIRQDGYVKVKDILSKPKFKEVSLELLHDIVDTDNKKRFTLNDEQGELFIRANQGHSIAVTELELIPITSSEQVPVCVHGTFMKYWEAIKTQGLSRMSRQHIHFAIGLPKENHVISGMRNSSDVLIYIDLDLAIKDGIQFFKSANDVVLSTGNAQGFVEPFYFKEVINMKTKESLPFEKIKVAAVQASSASASSTTTPASSSTQEPTTKASESATTTTQEKPETTTSQQ